MAVLWVPLPNEDVAKYCDLNYYENKLFEDPDSDGSDEAHPRTGLDGGDQEGGGEGQEHTGHQATSGSDVVFVNQEWRPGNKDAQWTGEEVDE